MFWFCTSWCGAGYRVFEMERESYATIVTCSVAGSVKEHLLLKVVEIRFPLE